jgi:hypothetical protein
MTTVYPCEVITQATAAAGFNIFLGGVFGLSAGTIVGGMIEFSLQEFERKFMESGKQEWRFWTAQGIRTMMVGGGTGLTVAAALGMLGITAVATTVFVCAAGVGLAVIGVAGMIYAGIRYYQRKKDNRAVKEYKRSVDDDYKRLRVIAHDVVNLNDDQIRSYLKQVGEGEYTKSDLLKALDLNDAGNLNARITRILTFKEKQ